MLFLLRKIRRKLLQKNQITTYLFYAVGEIILVVVGILLAVQIEAYYSALKERREELVLLEEMKNNLNQDLIDIDNNITEISIIIKERKELLAHLEHHTPLTNSLEKSYYRLYAGVFFANNTSAYKTFSSAGLNKISNDSLRKKITNLYDFHYPTIIKLETNIQPFYYKLVDASLDYFSTDISSQRSIPNNLESLYKNGYFKELLKTHTSFLYKERNVYHLIRKKVVELINNIDHEIKLK